MASMQKVESTLPGDSIFIFGIHTLLGYTNDVARESVRDANEAN